MSLRLSPLCGAIVLLTAAVVNADLVHRYSFESDASDSVGSANGSMVNGATVSLGQVNLDGSNDYVNLPAATIAINTFPEITLEIWSTQPAINQDYSMTAAFGGTWSDNGYGQDYIMISTTRGDEVSRGAIANTPDSTNPWDDEVYINGPELNDGLEHQYALTINSTQISFYIDGELEGSKPLGTAVISETSNQYAYLGRSLYTGDDTVECSINEFRIFDSALTADDIAMHYSDGPDLYREECPITIEQTNGSTEVTEGNSIPDTYTIALSSQPLATVTLTADPDGQLDIGNGPNNPAFLVYETEDWDQPQTIEVTAADDNDVETNPHTGIINHFISSSDPNFNDIYSPCVNVDIWENECGAWGYNYSDLNLNCLVEFQDFALLASLWLSEYDADDLETLSTEWLTCTTPYAPGCEEGEYFPGTGYLFSYFESNGDGLHLAYSYDGLDWTQLNNGQTFLTPSIGSGLMRDPCIIRGPDGIFRMVWTTGWSDNGIGYAYSSDLINWSAQTYIPVMGDEPDAQNCWAPEVFYDKAKQRYQIFWATTITGEWDNEHRIYYITTEDFDTFSSTALFFEQGFNVIDATILEDNEQFYMFVKNETDKIIRMTTSDHADGPWGAVSDPITPALCEGPTAIKIEGNYIVYFDKYTSGVFGAIQSQDMENWADISDNLNMPNGIRHGTVFSVPYNIIDSLIAYGE